MAHIVWPALALGCWRRQSHKIAHPPGEVVAEDWRRSTYALGHHSGKCVSKQQKRSTRVGDVVPASVIHDCHALSVEVHSLISRIGRDQVPRAVGSFLLSKR